MSLLEKCRKDVVGQVLGGSCRAVVPAPSKSCQPLQSCRKSWHLHMPLSVLHMTGYWFSCRRALIEICQHWAVQCQSVWLRQTSSRPLVLALALTRCFLELLQGIGPLAAAPPAAPRPSGSVQDCSPCEHLDCGLCFLLWGQQDEITAALCLYLSMDRGHSLTGLSGLVFNVL